MAKTLTDEKYRRVDVNIHHIGLGWEWEAK